jgi:hypothetical protein
MPAFGSIARREKSEVAPIGGETCRVRYLHDDHLACWYVYSGA